MYKLIGLLLFLLPLYLSAQSAIIQTDKGKIRGTTSENGAIYIYKGIPFAGPPVGDLRWKAPQPAKAWEGIKTCDTFGPSPVQGKPTPFMYWSSEFLIPEEPISEDCLYLNVWTGANNKTEKRPVLVYIYGGGFRSGGSGCPIYDGEAMAEKGVVFVSINYRVGVFGFLAHPELTQESSYGASGNYALLDMIAGLQWVRKNIAAFGGDPANVTIAGQSAGAFAVSYLTTSPLAKGLFHRAIAESGGSFVTNPRRPTPTLADAEKMGVEFAEKALNCQSLAEMRAKSADEVLQAQGGMSWPIIDGYAVPESCAAMYQQGKQNDVTLLLGWNAEDLVLFGTQSADEFKKQARERFGDQFAAVSKVYPMGSEKEILKSRSDMSRDETFAIQGYVWATLQDQHSKSNVYLYNFNRRLPFYTPETNFGAFHSGEIVYAYHNLHTLDRPWQAVDHQIANHMSSYWVNFARTGNPNGKGLPKWKAFKTARPNTLIIDTETKTTSLPDLNRLKFWEQYLSQ
ncbi:MAG: carboxylesterase family protein [Lewinella sp.]|nr:carboxylesterase family protein [Lewinella sp.]